MYHLKLNTTIPDSDLKTLLEQWAPWGHRIDFNNNISTKDFKRRTPFSENTLQKIQIIEKNTNLDKYTGGNLLDIGCNSGYNSIYTSLKYDLSTTGIDVTERHMKVSNFLKTTASADKCEFIIDNAETFSRPKSYDIILHFGTLYHLPNPLLSLENSYKNLRSGGTLALETQVYDSKDDSNLVYFMHMHNNDKTNFWALSTDVLKRYMEFIGFTNVKEILRVQPKILENGNMYRIIMIANK